MEMQDKPQSERVTNILHHKMHEEQTTIQDEDLDFDSGSSV